MDKPDIVQFLERQAEWQRSRRSLSWPEKIREAERVRPTIEAFRRMRLARAAHAAESQPRSGSADAQPQATGQPEVPNSE